MFFNCIKMITIISNGGRWVGSRLTGEHKPGQTAFSAALLSLALWPWSAALRNTNYANLKKMKLLLCCCCCRRCYQICLWTRNWRLDSTWLSFVVPNTFFLFLATMSSLTFLWGSRVWFNISRKKKKIEQHSSQGLHAWPHHICNRWFPYKLSQSFNCRHLVV